MTAAALAVNSIALDMQRSEQAPIVRKQTNSMGIHSSKKGQIRDAGWPKTPGKMP